MSQTFPETKNSYVCAMRNEGIFWDVQDIVHKKKTDYISDFCTFWSSEKITLPLSKSITKRQNLPIAYSGVTSWLAIHIPWRQDCQTRISALASSDRHIS